MVVNSIVAYNLRCTGVATFPAKRIGLDQYESGTNACAAGPRANLFETLAVCAASSTESSTPPFALHTTISVFLICLSSVICSAREPL